MIKKTVSDFLKIIRWNDYGPEKIPQMLLLCFYIALVKQTFSVSYMADVFVFILFAVVSSVYGYLVNDLSDKKIDLEEGKPNAFAGTSGFKGGLIVFGVFFLDIIFSVRFFNRPFFSVFLGLWLFFSTFYSLPPIRFKERGGLGIIVPAVAQLTLPVLIIFSIFNHFEISEISIFLIFSTIKGLSLILRHQILDFNNDCATNTKTYAVNSGIQKMKILYSWFLRAESVSVWLVIFLLFFKLAGVKSYILPEGVNPALPLFIVYGMFWAAALKDYFRGFVSDPYAVPGPLSFVHITFPSFILPAYLLMILTFNYHAYIVLVLLFLALNYQYTFKIKDRWLVKLLLNRGR